MSFQEKYAQIRRQHQENATWKLLRADNAPLILAFIADLFQESNEISFGQARSSLDAELSSLRDLGLLDTEVNANTYLRHWIQAGWLRELNDQITRTDACELALRFTKSLDHRDSNATASHLRIVQDAVRDLAVALSPNFEERITLLEAKKALLQREIDDLNAGILRELPEHEQRERIREVYQLASVLTGDFRRVEDEIRNLDQQLRIQMIESDQHRGTILKSLLEGENLLAESDAGQAFDGFFQLLCDPNRSMEFKSQLRSVLDRPAAKFLRSEQVRHLNRLFSELTHESDHVFRVRERTEESLRVYIESGAHLENKAVNKLLEQLEQSALSLVESGINLKTDTGLSLNSGSAKIQSLDSLKLKTPEHNLDTSDVEAKLNRSTPSNTMLQHLQAVKVTEVARKVKALLVDHGPLTVANVIQHLPVTEGLEELVAHLRIAKAIKSTSLPEREDITISGRDGERLHASIPHYLLSAEQFPTTIEELSL